ncbi:hypothetical protein F4808DRAFT_221133 [Astrocystis sublimbata]|nr:hypothetical protein F4808DRAFT_221133 [Astrocystis sublimbata]
MATASLDSRLRDDEAIDGLQRGICDDSENGTIHNPSHHHVADNRVDSLNAQHPNDAVDYDSEATDPVFDDSNDVSYESSSIANGSYHSSPIAVNGAVYGAVNGSPSERDYHHQNSLPRLRSRTRPPPIGQPQQQQHQPQQPSMRARGNVTTFNVRPSTDAAPSPAPTTASAAVHFDHGDAKRPRACEACRGLKVKCEPEPTSKDRCKRCAKAGRECVVTKPVRKRQRKTDSRINELEKKVHKYMEIMEAHTKNAGLPPPGSPSSHPLSTVDPATPPSPLAKHEPSDDPAAGAMAGSKRKVAETPFSKDEGPSTGRVTSGKRRQPQSQPQPSTRGHRLRQSHTHRPPPPPHPHPRPQLQLQPQPPSQGQDETGPDVVGRGIVSLEDAVNLFQRYTDYMVNHLPVVVFSPETTAERVRTTLPILFLAILSVASSENPDLQNVLVRELEQIFADRIIIQGQKSLELVQAIIVSVTWYFPPEEFEHLKFYQMINLAAVMAVDIGLGKRKNNFKNYLTPYTWADHPFRKVPLPEPTTIESRRTWLSVYFLASNVAMALHRPNTLQWQAFMDECIDILGNSPEAAPSDRYLCQLVCIHRIAEDVGIQFSMDDPSHFTDVNDSKIGYALRAFDRDLSNYVDDLAAEDHQPLLLLSISVMRLHMHEVALQTNDESKPANADTLRIPIPTLEGNVTPAQSAGIATCITAINRIFEIFLSLDVLTVRCLPSFNYVRLAYAVVIYIKLYYSASSPGSELAAFIDKGNLDVGGKLDSLIQKFRDAAGQNECRPASKLVEVFTLIQNWFDAYKERQSRDQGGPESTQDPHSSNPQAGLSAADPGTQHNMTQGQQHQHYPPPPQQQPDRQQQQQFHRQSQAPPEDPLQMLSEVATNDGLPRTQSVGPSSSSHQPVFDMGLRQSQPPPWGTPGTQYPQYVCDPNSALNPTAFQPGNHMSWPPDGPFVHGHDMSFMQGGHFETALSMTFQGGFQHDNPPNEMLQDVMENMDNFSNTGTGGHGYGGNM